MYLTTPAQMKLIEANADKNGLSYLTMMENAGRTVFTALNNITDKADLSKPVAVLCGKGNNGGDGFVCARLMSEAGLDVTVVLTDGEPVREEAMRSYMELSSTGIPVLGLEDNIDRIFDVFSKCGLVIDAVFGSGFHGELPPEIKACFSYISRTGAYKLAVDIPSGGDCLTGEVSEGTMKCDMTVTFAYRKVGTEYAPLCDYCGEINVTNIGIKSAWAKSVPYLIEIVDDEFIKETIPQRDKYAYKGDFGRLINFAGCRMMPGAAAMSTKAALRSGAGLVTLASASDVTSALSSTIHECTYLPMKQTADGYASYASHKQLLDACAKATAIAAGSGLGNCEDTKKLILSLLEETDCPVILDADGINCICANIDEIRRASGRLVVTPHTGELARLLDRTVAEVRRDRLSAAIEFSEKYDVIVVAKGMPTFVVADRQAFLINTGNPGLSRGGSGDVLTGIIAGLTAQGISPVRAAAAGAYLFGLAADMTAVQLSRQGMLPTDVIAQLPHTFAQFGL